MLEDDDFEEIDDADLDAVRERIRPWLDSARRDAWVPLSEEGDASPLGSKFSGSPWLSEHEDWPRCPGCRLPMQLMLQLDLGTLPEPMQVQAGGGLLQFFYCKSEWDECSACETQPEPFSPSHHIRIVVPTDGGGTGMLPDDAGRMFPARRIVGWSPVSDWPGCSDLDPFGAELGMNCLFLNDEGLRIDFTDDYRRFQKALMPCHTGEKLGGWPYWLQDPQRPDCPRCGDAMEFVFQFDSLRENIPYGFGDSGTGQIHQCANHRDVLAFGWASC